jgi:hypothetical protein
MVASRATARVVMDGRRARLDAHAESGEAHYRKALALAEPRGMRPLFAHCQLGLPQHGQATGRTHSST